MKPNSPVFWAVLSAGVLLFRVPVMAVTNDNFAAADLLSGTNFTYTSTLAGATLEAGEPVTAGTNTVWMTWTAPDSGYLGVQMAGFWPTTSYAVYTGPSVDQLQPVSLSYLNANATWRFVTTKGTAYHFQFSGAGDTFTFSGAFHFFGKCVNDNFADAPLVNGGGAFGPDSVIGATMELGEPAQMGDVPQKSLWWRIQSPVSTTGYIDARSSLVTNLALSFYTGDSLQTLHPIGESSDKYLSIHIGGGQTYYLAAAVPTNAWGDVAGFVGLSMDGWSEPIAGNLLGDPSWEGTGLFNSQYWKSSGNLEGFVNEPGGADGTTWPVLPGGTTIWQDFPTVPGHTYSIRFAALISSDTSQGGGDGKIEVLWDTNELAVSVVPEAESGAWHWITYTAGASNSTSRISFRSLTRAVELDAFSVVDASAPPEIVTQPASVSTIAGGTASFVVGATGTAPLHYQWCFNQEPISGKNDDRLVLNSVITNQAGNYSVIITNGFGSATSQVASLVVDAPHNATILAQPFGDTVPLGGYFQASVVASGTPPLTYQWFQDGVLVEGATNRSLILTNVQNSDAGSYKIRVEDASSAVWSLPAVLTVSAAVQGGGTIDFRNDFPGWTNAWAPVFDLDGATPLSGRRYVAQLYAGPTLAELRPAGKPTPFKTGFNAGFFYPQLITLANVPPGGDAFVEVMAWDTSFGDSYEQARVMGGKVGKSEILQITTGGGAVPAGSLLGLPSFSLQAGLPYFQVATIRLQERQPGNRIVWALEGEPGSLYVIEKSDRKNGIVWRPFTVVTNTTGTVTFTDQASSGSAVVLYRARILN